MDLMGACCADASKVGSRIGPLDALDRTTRQARWKERRRMPDSAINQPHQAEHLPAVATPARGGRCRGSQYWQLSESGLTLIEVLIVIVVTLVILGLALPSASQALKSYRLTADVSDVAGMLSAARMQAASQFAPYRMDIDTTQGTYVIEKLCGNTPTSGAAGADSNCTSAYNPFSTPEDELGTQYAYSGDSFASCRPSGIGSYPGTITGDASGCPSVLQIYFNTRGAPVDLNGNPLSNGGAVLYATSPDNMVQAITVSAGGRVATWLWSSGSSQWTLR